jgi:hypothetical protein
MHGLLKGIKARELDIQEAAIIDAFICLKSIPGQPAVGWECMVFDVRLQVLLS